ncbi:MAG: hypothetical protein A2504_11365 [Bdellovibrionales bacterium RIFOXYD12_FULL_39_22]|nr:MAG: hypothetical protein A2385_09930 [Bdellovibrionales bacterium RIFOXYB1_FULL_39_21]OFZ44270.1 MAG: hypothetical protein A2485_07550 [Bdellovibrionales bacterium RIFOXYC12_FULL_39_17]OFZ46812.1 MAG: hypothetical protein A2404_04785 [Bdellovibrionales bacterium RIFOXYC1_FULL_39_130]OFZ71004.1 MAG: hypothetical protein A2451_00285 [Bdellovibrionales bacterium RIFOXYC2_FULL_39_8]OFZ75911.1 MAG: hypothetical protein A2560_02365 [Bdellovibrionales bacterium RIFOXYD1_FULL_39_84]OFZ95491.1 MAG:
MVNIYRLKTNRTLFSFGENIGAVPVGDSTLKDFQEKIVHEAGMTLREATCPEQIGDDDFLAFEDDLLFTKDFLLAVLNLLSTQNSSCEFYFSDNTFNRRFLLPFTNDKQWHWTYAFRYYKKKGPSFLKILIPQKIFENHIKLPSQIVPSGKYHVDQCAIWISKMASPFHLLYANLALNLGRAISIQNKIPPSLTQIFFPLNSRPYFWALRRLNKFGKRNKIHPSAILEGVELGDDVTIGANCVVRMSKLCSGTTLEDNVVINYSILGCNNFVSAGNFINLCMSYENVFLIHGPYQFSIFGKNVAVMAVINCDIRLDNQEITIPTNAGMINSRQHLLGIAYGHYAVVGAGNIIAPGRIVPNRLKLPPPDNILTTKFKQEVPL